MNINKYIFLQIPIIDFIVENMSWIFIGFFNYVLYLNNMNSVLFMLIKLY